MKTYVCVYFGAALVAMFAMPLVVRLARVIGLMDRPGVRKVHDRPVPRIGGVAIFVGFFALTVPVLLLDNTIGQAFREVQMELLALTVGAVLAFVVGLIDDVRNLRATLKLVALLAGAMLVCAAGSRIQHISIGDWVRIELGWFSWAFTIAWIAAIAVGMNFLDGLDGLAAGVAAIVCGTIAIFALWSGQLVMAVLMLGLLGSLTGFLFFNFHPAKVFMGDGGSMFIGFTIGAGSVLCQAKTSTFVGIAVPLLALGVPLLDTFFTMIRRRVIDRRSIFVAEKGHLHHRLLAKGLQHQTAVFVVYGTTLVSTGIGLSMLVTRGGWTILVFAGGLTFLFVAFAAFGSTRLRETLAALRRNHAIASEARTEREHFEETQLRMREARSFTDWWQAVCAMAASLEFRSVALWCRDQGLRSGRLVWRSPQGKVPDEKSIEISLPVARTPADGAWQLKVRIAVGSFLESAGRRAALLGRLIDEHPPPVGDGQAPLFASALERINATVGRQFLERSTSAGDGPIAAAQ